MLPALDKRGELFSLLIAECHDVLLHCVLFAGHESAPSLVTGTSIQRTRAESMTDTTRDFRLRPAHSAPGEACRCLYRLVRGKSELSRTFRCSYKRRAERS